MDYRTDRYSSQPVYIETFNELFLFESDFALIFGIDESPTRRWVVEDIRTDGEGDIAAFTRVVCLDEQTGETLFHNLFADTEDDGLLSNSLYAIIIQYVDMLGYDTGQLLVDIQVPKTLGSYYENGALMRLSWHSFTNIDLGALYEVGEAPLPQREDEGEGS